MKLIVATRRTQGCEPGDHCHALEGELVHLPLLECHDPLQCGCGRGFAGVTSHRSTTTAEIVDRALTEDEVVDAVRDSLRAAGWLDGLPANSAGQARALAGSVVLDLLTVATALPLGTVVGRDGSRLRIRHPGRSGA